MDKAEWAHALRAASLCGERKALMAESHLCLKRGNNREKERGKRMAIIMEMAEEYKRFIKSARDLDR